ncbi:signal peptide peptidase-like 2A isoform X2 [Hemicordylus capensis]|uniref:signal peptide peptidase-like 2A isoform X2 n=1 Tax=Hemicordylus capensis TaxID=884348 RepID=UPI0023046752|nr:signal peptide peptidase-like 2A isoform X2 [Hemicordylus capensis]
MGASALALLRAALWALLPPLVNARYGILHAFKSSQPQLRNDYCMYYDPDLISLPETLTDTTSMKLAILTPKWFCSDSDKPHESIQDKAVAVESGNCSLLQKGQMAQNLGAKAVLVVLKDRKFPPKGNMTQYKVSIPVVMIRELALHDMKESFGSNINVTLYAPPLSNFDFNMVFIFLIAVLIVALGSYWSGMKELEKLAVAPSSENSEETPETQTEEVIFNPLIIAGFFTICSVSLVLMYFFFKYLVFALLSSIDLYKCLRELVIRIPYGQCRLACYKINFEVRLFFLAGICLATSTVWVVFRNEESWSWILLDILGAAFCLDVITLLKVPSFKLCVLFLLLLFVYDIFFVFITPFLTKSGKSIMVEVATGSGDSKEKLPGLFKVPPVNFPSLMFCFPQFSMLGFGDVLLPGFQVAYCCRFDVRTGSHYVYFISCTIAYAVGLVITFVALILMKRGQPALLYLVPSTLITSAVVAFSRKEMKQFWNGST